MLLRIQPMTDSIKAMYSNHEQYHEGDSGLDVFFPEEVRIQPRETKIIDLHIRCEAVSLNDNTKYLSYYLYPRSSISKTPLRMSNSVGIIDAGYRGTLKVSVDNISEDPYYIQKGQRLFQICSPTLDPLWFQLCDDVSETSRGEGGFGSTD